MSNEKVLMEELGAEEAERAFSDDPAGGVAPNDARPTWIVLPPGFEQRVPVGKKLAYFRFFADWTDTPHLGDRQCVLWPLTEGEEKRAYERARTDNAQVAMMELSKACIRVVDGHWSDWTGDQSKPGSVQRFVDQIGRRCAREITNWYLRAHVLTGDQRELFFEECVVFGSAQPG